MGSMYQRNKNLINQYIRNYTSNIIKKNVTFLISERPYRLLITLNNDYWYTTWEAKVIPEIKAFRAIPSKDGKCVFICGDIKSRIDSIKHYDGPLNDTTISNPVYKELYNILFYENVRYKSENLRRDDPVLAKVSKKEVDDSPSILFQSKSYYHLYKGYEAIQSIVPKSKIVDKLYPQLPERDNILPVAVFTEEPVPSIDFIKQFDSTESQLNPSRCRIDVTVLRKDEYIDSVRYIRIDKWLVHQVYDPDLTEIDKSYRPLIRF